MGMKEGGTTKSESTAELLTYSAGAVLFFTIHNFLQEAIMKRPGFKFGWALGMLEMIGTCCFSAIERIYYSSTSGTSINGEVSSPEKDNHSSGDLAFSFTGIASWLGSRVLGRSLDQASSLDYIIVASCLMISSSLSNIALNYINFPTKVVFRSCKLLPTMTIAVCIHQRSFHSSQWIAAFFVCIGLVLVGLADVQTFGEDFHVLGLVLVAASVVADSIMPNVQQKLFQKGESRADVVFVTNLLVSICMVLSLGVSGDLTGALAIASQDSVARYYMITYASVAYIAVSFHMKIVQRFGGVVGVLVGNGRKLFTILCSFVLFPKPLSLMYVIGVLCSLGGLTASVILRERNANVAKMKNTSSLDKIPARTFEREKKARQGQRI